MLDLNEGREIFANYMAADPAGKWRMDASLAHVLEWAYRRGLEDGAKQEDENDQHKS